MPSDRANADAPPRQGKGRLGLQELEEELCRLGGVLAVRVVGDRVGRPIEMHVLADNTKPAKQTVRDVRSVAQTVFGLELDHRIVSVAQFDANDTEESTHSDAVRNETRVRVGSVKFDSEGVRATVQVVLATGEQEQSGYAEGSVAAIGRPQLVASAALDALRQLEPAADAVHLSAADITRVGRHRMARGDRCVGRTTARAADVRLGGRTPRPRRRHRASTPRRSQPPPVPLGIRRGALRRAGPPTRASLLVQCNRSRSWSRIDSAAPTASPSRRASGNGRCTSSASASAASPASSTTACDPTTPGSPSSPSIPLKGAPPIPARLSATLAGADLVVVENLCSLPINPDASTLAADVLAEHSGPVVFHHHDLPWQRAGLAAPDGIPPHRPNSLHVTVNDYSRIQLEHRDFEAVTVRNTFDLDPPQGDREATRAAFGFARDDLVLLQPSRAIPRKNVPAAVEFATKLAGLETSHACVSGSRDPLKTATTSCSRASSPTRASRSPLGALRRLSDAYAAADLVVYPSTWEGFGNPVIESIAHRRPIAVGSYPALDELRAFGVELLSVDDPEGAPAWLRDPRPEVLEANVESRATALLGHGPSQPSRSRIRSRRMGRVVTPEPDPVLERRGTHRSRRRARKARRVPAASRCGRCVRRGGGRRASRAGRSRSRSWRSWARASCFPFRSSSDTGCARPSARTGSRATVGCTDPHGSRLRAPGTRLG